MIAALNKYRDSNGYLNIPGLNICRNGTMSENYINLYLTSKLVTKVKAFIPTNLVCLLKKKGNVKSIRGTHVIDDSEYFCKIPTGLRPYSSVMESLASIIGNYLGGSYLDYDIIENDEAPFSSISSSFLSPNSAFQSISEMLPNSDKQFTEPSLEEIVGLLDISTTNKPNKKKIIREIIQGLIIDALLQQFDRHTLNLGFIKTDNGLALPPFFDNEYWFPSDVSTATLKQYCNSAETFSVIKYYAFLRRTKNYYQANLFGYSIYDFIIAILTNKVDGLRVPGEIKEIILSIDINFINNILSFNPFSILDLIQYHEIRNNEVYGILIKQCQLEFIKKLELKDKMKY